MTTVFEMRRVTKVFGGHVALRDLSLRGDEGQILALLGENGAGKTTAIKIMLGLLRPDSGTSRVLGMDSVAHGAEVRRSVGYMPDRPALYEWMTVEEIGWFAGGFHPIGYRQRYVDLIRKFKLPADRPIKSLSKGMQGKVSLALALAHQPQLLVLDEPTSGLDPMVRREFLETMVDVAANGRTVLLSSHQIAEVERIADSIAIIREGRLVLCESLETLKERVHEVIVTMHAVETAPPLLPEQSVLIGSQREDRTWRLLVRDLDAAARQSLEVDPNHNDVVLRRPSLEEIYMACMTSEFSSLDPLTVRSPVDVGQRVEAYRFF
jgi:ABC-2 type transport system ATP-binding protein